MKNKITGVLLLSCLKLCVPGCGKNATDTLLDKMESISKQKSVLESKLKLNTPGAEKDMKRLSEIAQSFRKRIETA